MGHRGAVFQNNSSLHS